MLDPSSGTVVSRLFSGLALLVRAFPGRAGRAGCGISAVLVGLAGWTALGGILLRVIWASKQRMNAAWQDPYQPPREPGAGPAVERQAAPVALGE